MKALFLRAAIIQCLVGIVVIIFWPDVIAGGTDYFNEGQGWLLLEILGVFVVSALWHESHWVEYERQKFMSKARLAKELEK